MSSIIIGYIVAAAAILILLNTVYLRRQRRSPGSRRGKTRPDTAPPTAREDEAPSSAPPAPAARPVKIDDDLKGLIHEVLDKNEASHEPPAAADDDAEKPDILYSSSGPIIREAERQETPSAADRPKPAATEDGKPKPPADTGTAAEKNEADQGGAERKEPLHVGQIMAVLLIGAFVTILNQTLINVALPHMMTDLNVSANTIQWLVTGYMLVNGVLIPISAFLVETFTTKKLFIAAMMFFAVGSIVCGLAPNFPILLSGRLVQAVGAGIIMPLMMNVFLTIFPPEQRGKAMGMMGLAMVFAPAIGPTLSGWLVEHYNWRWLFFLVLPIAAIDILLALGWMKDVLKLRYPKFDLAGAVYSTIGFGSLLYGFSEAGNKGWDSGEVVLTLVIGSVFLIAFVLQSLRTENPILEFRVYKFSMFSLTTIISAIINMAMFAGMVLLPIYLQSIRGFTPLESGLLLLPGAILMGIMSPIAGAIFDKIGARWLAVFGLLVTVTTTFEFTKLTDATSYPHILLLYTFRMAGMAFLMMPIMTAGLNQLPRKLNAHGTAMSNTMRQVAGSLGTALLVTVMTNRADFHAANFGNVITSTNPQLSTLFGQLGQGLAAGLGIPAQAGGVVATQLIYGMVMKESTIQGINDAFLWATIIAGIALVLAFFIQRTSPPDAPRPRPGRKASKPSATGTALAAKNNAS